MDVKTLSEPSACVDEALHVHRTSTTAWETAATYYRAVDDAPRPHLNEVADPGIRHHSCQPLPQAFTSQYTNVQFKSFMGLFPQINRAWLTVDSNLFLWAYTPFAESSAASDFYVYEGFSQIIVSVALITPRPGVFVETVRYLLAVATPIEVTLLGVTFSASGQLSLVPTNISIPTDNVLMLKILSADDGRIFMAGADGGLHQFIYAPHQSSSVFDLFSSRPRKRARKIAHSSSSIASYLIPAFVKSWFYSQNELVDLAIEGNTLYALSQAGILSVYDISKDTVAAVATSVIARDAQHLFTFSISPADREFVSIHPVASPSSASVQLIVVTSFAERIYYSTLSSRNASSYSSSARPTTLRCVGYRPSPDIEQSQSSSRPCIHIAWCHRGAAVFADLKDTQSDRLICIYPDANISNSQFSRSDTNLNSPRSIELVISTSLDANLEYNNPSFPQSTPAPHSTFNNAESAANTPVRTFAIAEAELSPTNPEISGSMDPPNLFWVLTSTAIHLYERINPVDKLRDILSSGDESSRAVQQFFDRYGPSDSCAMCLEIAILDPSLSRAAATVFYASGGKPVSQRRRGGGSSSRYRGASEEVIDRRYFDVGRAALQSTPLARFSGAHDGITIYLAKVLNPIWNNYITADRNPEAYQRLADSKEMINSVRDQLLAVASFLEHYAPDDMLPKSKGRSQDLEKEDERGDLRGMNRQSTSARDMEGSSRDRIVSGLYQLKRTDEARRIESNAIVGLKHLAIRTSEALALLLILSDHQLHRLTVAMPIESRRRLAEARLSELIISERGSIVASSLIEAIFSSYADGAVAVSSVGRMLQERCTSYFGVSDVDLHRGLALLRQAAESVSNPVDMGNQSAGINERGSGGQEIIMGTGESDDSIWTLALKKSDDAGVILKAVAGRVFDVDGICKDFTVLNAIPTLVDVVLTIGGDAETTNRQDRAKHAYDSVLNALRPLISRSNVPTDRGSDGWTEQKTQLREASLHVALNNKSEIFLQRLYDFLKESKAGEDLLLKHWSPSVENYLIRNEALEALWKYYTQHERNFDAGTVLLKLAETGKRSLVDRLNFLSCALLNLRTATSRGDDRASHLLGEVTDFLDVAKVQLRIHEELQRRRDQSAEVKVAVQELNEEMLNLSCLFNKYARRFHLQEACLECLRCGGYRDDGYVRQLWIEILDREGETASSAVALGQRLEAIGREFYPSDVVFPTNFMIHLLEKFVCESKATEAVDGVGKWKGNVEWVMTILQTIGVGMSDLADGYRRLLESQQNGGVFDESWSWTEQVAQVHLLQVTERVICKWIDQLCGEGKVNGRRIISEADKVMRVLQVCKTRLRGMNRTNSSDLWQMFEALERRIGSISQ